MNSSPEKSYITVIHHDQYRTKSRVFLDGRAISSKGNARSVSPGEHFLEGYTESGYLPKSFKFNHVELEINLSPGESKTFYFFVKPGINSRGVITEHKDEVPSAWLNPQQVVLKSAMAGAIAIWAVIVIALVVYFA